MVYTKILQCCKGLCFVHVTGLGDLVGLKLQRGTWRNGQSVAPCQCHCLLWGFKPRLVHDFQRIKSCFSLFIVGTLYLCFAVGQGNIPSHASLVSGVAEYTVGQKWQFIRYVQAEISAGLTVCSPWKLHLKEHIQWPSKMWNRLISLQAWYQIINFPANTKHLYNICTTSAQRLRRFSNIVQMRDLLCLLFLKQTTFRLGTGCVECCSFHQTQNVKPMLV